MRETKGRKPCCDKVGLKKGPWTAEEDKKLINFMFSNCHCSWRAVPKLAGLLRCGKSCRLRWINYLRPDLKRGLLSDAEEKMVIDLHSQLGNRWSKIASHLPGRTDNEIKNYWNTHIKKKLRKMGIDHFTHKPTATTNRSNIEQPEAHCEGAEEQKAKTISSIEIDEATLQKSPGFCVEEVPMVLPHELVIPAASIDSSASISPCSSSCFSQKSEVLQYSPEWLEPIDLWLMDDTTAWDLGFNDADEVLSVDAMI